MLNRWLLRLSATAIALAIAATIPFAGLSAEPVSVRIVLASDLYSIESGETRGGYARLAGLVARERAAHDNVLVFHAGDALSPSLLSGFDNGAHVIELLNTIGLDAFAPGNHEFDFGPEVFRQRMAEARFPVLAANVRDSDAKPLAGISDTRMFDFTGAKIGVAGLTTEETEKLSSPGDIRFGNVIDSLERQSAALRAAGADVVIALTHTDAAQNRDIVRTRLADLVLSGHNHDLTLFYDGRTLLAESKAEADYIVVIDLSIDIGEKDGKRTVKWTPGFRIVDTADIAPDPKVAARIAELEVELSGELDVELATAGIALDSRRATVRTQESAIGNLIADAMRTATGADVALTNGGGIRGDKTYDAGHALTRRDVLTELPFGNKTVVVALTGAQIKTALENGVSAVENAGGRFAQVSGIRLEADLAKPKGERVTKVEIGGAPLDETKTYTLATNDFLLRGGDGYAVFGEGEVVLGDAYAKLMANDVMVYVRKNGTDGATLDGRVTLK